MFGSVLVLWAAQPLGPGPPCSAVGGLPLFSESNSMPPSCYVVLYLGATSPALLFFFLFYLKIFETISQDNFQASFKLVIPLPPLPK